MNHNHNTALDGPADRASYDKRDQTGLLTRFVPDKLKNTAFYRWILRLSRVLQFLSSVISLGIFAGRVAKVYRLVNGIKTQRGINNASGAVLGILAAAVLYTLITMLLGCIKKSANPGGRVLRWIWVLMDLLFVGAFIAVAVLTRKNGSARRCYNTTVSNATTSNNASGSTSNSSDSFCNLPWGTFALAIISTLLHALTASFHEIKDHRRRNRVDREKDVSHPHPDAAK